MFLVIVSINYQKKNQNYEIQINSTYPGVSDFYAFVTSMIMKKAGVTQLKLVKNPSCTFVQALVPFVVKFFYHKAHKEHTM